MNGHHLVLGERVDFITGETLADTHDERYRQKIARLLVNQKGYLKDDIEPRKKLLIEAGNKKALVKIDFIIKIKQRFCMVINYGPGSLVTRYRPVLAASRLIASYQVPIAVVTNGQDAAVLEGSSGKTISQGLDSICAKPDLTRMVAREAFIPISDKQAEMESRILYCYEVDDRCECDDTICRL